MIKNIDRVRIAKKIRNVRKARRWSQKALAAVLGLSQNRLSELERGKGSFSAEHLLTLLRHFNLTIEDFGPASRRPGSGLQNSLVRLGASHLRSTRVDFPSQEYSDPVNTLFDVLEGAESRRFIAALAPILAGRPRLAERSWVRFKAAGLARRLGWVVACVLAAVRKELESPLPRVRQLRYLHAATVLESFLRLRFGGRGPGPGPADILDADIITQSTVDELKKAGDPINLEWGVVSHLKVADFCQALKSVREAP